MNPLEYAKAIVGGLISGLSVIATGLDDGSIDAQEIIFGIIAFLVALGAVWAVPNRSAGP